MSGKYVITIQDVNGITFESVTNKVSDGQLINLLATEFTKAYENQVDPKIAPNRRITASTTTGTTYSDLKSPVSYSGLVNPTYNITGIINIESNNPGETIDSQPVRNIDLNILHDLVTVPNKYYLKDYITSDPSIKTPINGLMNHDDFFTTWKATPSKVYSSDGAPVVVQSADVSRPYETEDGLVVTYSLVLMEDK